MPLLTLTAGCLAYGDLPLLEQADFQLDAGERVALVGRNGSGKSSLLAALAGAVPLDDGVIWRAAGLTLGHVAQEPVLDARSSVFEAVAAGMGEIAELLAEYHAVSNRLAGSGERAGELLPRLHRLQEALEARGAWSHASQAERVIERFGLDARSLVGELSGGQRKRVAIARALSASPDVLLLDEPTNHLDIEAIAWLERLLVDRAGALIVVSHDRRFLDRVATRIVELDRGALTSHACGFAQYRQRAQRMLADEAVRNRKLDRLLREEEAWIRQGVEARRTRARSRVQRLEALRAARAERRERLGRVRLALDAGAESGALVAELESVSKSFGANPVVREFSCRILRGDRVGVIGRNGAGKTTLLKLILGELAPDSGRVRLGTRISVASFDQFREALDPRSTLAEVISPGSQYVEVGGVRRHVIGYLGDFLFPPGRARSPVASLSGGERNRLLLARLFARPANLLVLDEPTNDLDIETLELLEALLQEYRGTLLLVSHDREFLDNVVTQTIAADGGGIWIENAGGHADWMAWCAQREAARAGSRAAKPAIPPAAGASAPRRQARRPDRLSFGEGRELEGIPERIAALEAEQKDLLAALASPELHRGAAQAARAAALRLAEIEAELDAVLERWEALEARAAAGS